ncbi:MAG: hypothetical protein K2N42_04895, partial [Anaeroplasmataceae bacterium]|nr:hypothetical protein [Anaeroplasmataceae bacterium]
MKSKLIYFTIVFLSLALFLCSCMENPSDINPDNDFDLTNQEVKENREKYKKLEIAIKNYEAQFEKANSTEMILNTFINGSGISSSQQVVLNSMKSPMYISLQTDNNPIFLFQKE